MNWLKLVTGIVSREEIEKCVAYLIEVGAKTSPYDCSKTSTGIKTVTMPEDYDLN